MNGRGGTLISQRFMPFTACCVLDLKFWKWKRCYAWFGTCMSLVSSPDCFFPFLLDDSKERVWWNFIGLFVLQIPRFWELLIGVDKYKG